MQLVLRYLQKLNLLDPKLIALLESMAVKFNRLYPAAHTASQFDANVSAFLRRELPHATQPTLVLVRLYLAFDQSNGPGSGQSVHLSNAKANLSPGARQRYEALLQRDQIAARNFLAQEMMQNFRLLNEILTNVSKTRSEIAMTTARNLR